ncbi:MAG TPA: ADP-ribosylglycohydrolase family protein [Tepidisphaeraceae bacterium]|jgi:hypothetical protein
MIGDMNRPKNEYEAGFAGNPNAVAKQLLEAIALGDALGATTEFLDVVKAIKATTQYRCRGYPFVPVGGGWLHLRPGDHTDDTDMALGLLKGLRESGDADFSPAVAANWSEWLAGGPPDVGSTVRAIVGNPRFIVDPFGVSRDLYQSNPGRCANGALMRNGITGAAADLPRAFDWSLKQGIMTHYHPLSAACCAVQTWLIREGVAGRWPFDEYPDWLDEWKQQWTAWLDGSPDPVVRRWHSDVREGGRLEAALQTLGAAEFDPDAFVPFTDTGFPERNGWALLSLQVAVWAMRWARRPADAFPFRLHPAIAHHFVDVLDVFARRGHEAIGWVPLVGWDVDTYGAIAGPLIAAACGGPFPERMTETLAVRKIGWLFQ